MGKRRHKQWEKGREEGRREKEEDGWLKEITVQKYEVHFSHKNLYY